MERCAVCGICNAPLMLGLDGKLHCADCAPLLMWGDTQKGEKGKGENGSLEEKEDG